MDRNSKETSQIIEPDKNFKTSLNNWITERLKSWTPKPMEAKARWMIAQAIIKDQKQPKYLPEQVLNRTRRSIELLQQSGVREENQVVMENHDSIYPKEKFQTVFKRENGFWVAEERTGNGSLISQAKVGDNGETSLTITPQGERFKNANPGIINNEHLPRATVATFNLLIESIKTKND